MRWWLGVFLGLGVGSLAGCLLELDLEPICGDGNVARPLEECEPGLPESLTEACRLGETPTCDATTCLVHCERCGDSVLDDGEACEGNLVRVQPACQAWTCVSCQIECPRCGNGLVEPDEECDYLVLDEVAMLSNEASCDEIEVPGRPGTFYEPGSTATCRSDCRWDRSTCNLCGNGLLDDQIIDPNTGGPINAPERCDGEEFDLADRFDRCEAACGVPGRDCKVACGQGCLDIRIDPEDSGCCVLPDYARSSSSPCCCELPVGDVPGYCSGTFDPPFGGGSDGGTTSPTCPG